MDAENHEPMADRGDVTFTGRKVAEKGPRVTLATVQGCDFNSVRVTIVSFAVSDW